MSVDYSMKLSTQIITLTKKELRSYFDSTTAYIVMIVFLLLAEFLFFRQAFIIGQTSLALLAALLPWLFILLIPALTMGSVANEKSEGTLEFVLTHGVTDRAFIIGKFLGATIFCGLILLFLFPIAISFSFFGNLDWGVIFGQYFAALFLAGLLVALGAFISTCFSNQISSLVVTGVAVFLFLVLGLDIVTAMLPGFLVSWFNTLSPLSHYESLGRGVVDLRDLWYFASATVVFLGLAYLQLLRRRLGNQKQEYRRFLLGVCLFLGIAVLSNIIGAWIPGRFDLTQDKLYTMSPSTKKILGELQDVVNINLYASKQIPGQFQSVLRETKDILRDYQTLSKGNITVAFKDPSSPEVAQEAQSLGIRQVQFNVVGQGELQLKNGFMGLAVSFGDKHEAIPFIQNTADLEYQLTSFIRKLTIKDKKKIAFLTGQGEKSLDQDYQAWKQEMDKQFEAQELTQEKGKPVPDEFAAIVVAAPTKSVEPETRAALKEFLAKGKGGLFLFNPVSVNLQTLSASPEKDNFSDFAKDYGVTVNSDLVYDLRSNASVRFGGGFLSFVLPYALWPRALPQDKQSPITARLDGIVLPWASSLTLDEAKTKELGLSAVKLFATSDKAGAEEGSFTLQPDYQFPQVNLASRLMAVALTNETQKSRMIVLGDAKLFMDQFIQENPQNMAFGMGALSWLAGDESLADLRIKQMAERKLLFQNQTQIALTQYGNMGLVLLAPLLFGLTRLMRRRGKRKQKYQS